MITVKIGATIPTVQYGNIMPEIEATGETYEIAMAVAMEKIQALWDKYGERPLVNKKGDFQILDTFTGEKIQYDPVAHVYLTMAGDKMLSGSEYKKLFDKPFDTALLSGKVGKKYNVDPAVIAAMWKANSKISTTFGNSLHYAMEQWFKYRDASCGEEKQYNLAKPLFLRDAVQSFPLKDAHVIPEVLLSNTEHKMAGQTDGLVVTDLAAKQGYLIDYKSDADIADNLSGHFKQLSFYAKILSLNGWSVGKVVVWNYTDVWTPYESEVLEVELPKK